MAVVSLKPGYEFQARDRAEVFGDDMLIHVYWKGNMLFCSAAAFRAPKAIKFGDFKANMLSGVFGADSSFAELNSENTRWTVDGKEVKPTDDTPLSEVCPTHKGLIMFERVG
jgi:phenol hydroxylase P4 protein